MILNPHPPKCNNGLVIKFKHLMITQQHKRTAWAEHRELEYLPMALQCLVAWSTW